MAMNAEEIISLIKASLPDAHVEMTDLAGDNDHWKAVVTSSAFIGKSRVAQHQMVYAALKGAQVRPLLRLRRVSARLAARRR